MAETIQKSGCFWDVDWDAGGWGRGEPGISGKLLDKSQDQAGPAPAGSDSCCQLSSQGGGPVSEGQGLFNKTQGF